jgi:hypothetical protein
LVIHYSLPNSVQVRNWWLRMMIQRAYNKAHMKIQNNLLYCLLF